MEAQEAEVVTMMLRLASGELLEAALAAWFRHHLTPESKS